MWDSRVSLPRQAFCGGSARVACTDQGFRGDGSEDCGL